jgi:uncharacterized membrane protein YfcA
MKIKTWVPHPRNKWLDLAPLPIVLIIVLGAAYCLLTKTKLPDEALMVAIPLFMVMWFVPMFMRKWEVVEIDPPDEIEVSRFNYRDAEGNVGYVSTTDKVICKIVRVERDGD